jgi:Tol biopolymer transport system component
VLLAPSSAAADRLRTIDVATGATTTLASSPNLEWLDRPCWAPDGRVVALEYRSTRHALLRRYVAYDALGNRAVLGRASRFTTDSALAPGCARVAERRRRMPLGGRGVMVREVAGAPLAELSSRGPARGGLAWSPDGRLLAAAVSAGFPLDLRVLEAEGGREVARTLAGFGSLGAGAFSPDGGHLAMAAGDPRVDFEEIAFLDVATGAESSTGERPEVDEVAWSPRGDRLAARIGLAGLELFDRDGRRLGPVAPGARVNRDFAWSPDGTNIAFTTRRRTGTSHYVVAAEPGAAHRLLLVTRGLAASPLAWSPDGTRIAVGGG